MDLPITFRTTEGRASLIYKLNQLTVTLNMIALEP